MVFREAAAADEVRRTRPHTIMGRVARTRQKMPEEGGNPEADRSKKVCFARVHRPRFGPNQDTLDSDLEEYFGNYDKVISVSQEREKDSGYIKFDDEDPMDRAMLVGKHHIKTAVLEAKRGPGSRQQKEIQRKCEQQEQTGNQRQITPAGRTQEVPDPVHDLEQRTPGAGEFKSFREQECLVSIRHPTNARSKRSRDMPGTKGSNPDSTNQLLSSHTLEEQGSRHKCRQLPEREQEAWSTRGLSTAAQTIGRIQTGGRGIEQRVEAKTPTERRTNITQEDFLQQKLPI